MSLNNSGQDVSEEDAANTCTGQRFLWLLQEGGVQSAFCHIVLPAANRPKDKDGLFPLSKDKDGCLDACVWMCTWVCIHRPVHVPAWMHACVSVHVCLCVYFLAKTKI